MQGPSSQSNDDSWKLQLKAYAMLGAKLPERYKGCVPVMVSIMAPPSGLTAALRKPVDLVVVLHIDNKFKMPEKWKELLKAAVKTVLEKLDDKDSLAIVPVQPTLLQMSDHNKIAASDAASKLIITSDTSMTRDLQSAESILYGRKYEDKDRRRGYIIVISNSNDNIESLLPWSFRSVHAFGFRDSHNARAMHSMVGSRDCIYTILDDEYGRITTAFAASIDRITSAMPIEVILKCEHQVELSSIAAPRISYFITQDRKVGMMWGSVHRAGAATNIVIYVNNLNVRHDQDVMKLITVQVKYGYDLAMNKLDGQVAAVRKGVNGYNDMAAEMVRIKALEIVNGIIGEDKKDSEQLHVVAEGKKDSEQLHAAADILKNLDFGKETDVAADILLQQWTQTDEAGLISRLKGEMQEMEIRLYNDYFWLEYMLSWQSHQRWQLPLPPLFMKKPVPNNYLVQLEIFAMVEDAIPVPMTNTQCLPVLLLLKAPEAGLAMAKCQSVDLVIILDVVKETWEEQELVIKAMKVVIEKLSHKDRLAIIHIQSPVDRAAAGLLVMCKQGRSKTSTVVRELFTAPSNNMVSQTLHWRDQINKAVKLVRKCLHTAPVNSPISTPTSSKRQSTTSTTSELGALDGSTKLWTALTDPTKILDDRGEKHSLGFIVVITDRDGQTMVRQKRSLMSKYITHAFGFSDNDTNNARVMHHIASSSNGIYGILNDRGRQISESFTQCIKKITSTVAIQAKLDIKCSHSSTITLSTAGLFGQAKLHNISDDRRSASIFAGDISADTVRNFLVYVDNVDHTDNTSISKLLEVHVKWLCAPMISEEVDGQVVIERSEEVAVAMARIEAAKIVNEITDPSYGEKLMADSMALAEAVEIIVSEGAKQKSTHEITDPSYGENLLADSVALAERAEIIVSEIAEQKTTHETIDPSYTKLLSDSVTLAEGVKIVSERTKPKTTHEITDSSYIAKLLADPVALAEAVKIVRERTKPKTTHEITDSSYVAELVIAILFKMCRKGSEKARYAGSPQLAREMEKIRDGLEDMLRRGYGSQGIKITTSCVIKLVEDRLPSMLSWLSFQMLCEQKQPPSLP